MQASLKNLSSPKSKNLVDEICQFLGEKNNQQQVSLDWEQLRQLNQGGIVIGAHSQSHPLLTQIPLDDAKSEIFGSQDGQNDLHTSNPFRLCRTNITRRTSLPIFKFRLTKLGAVVDNWRHR